MSKKSVKISGMIAGLHGRELDPHYLGFFECFNDGRFYEAHDVLEELWLRDRKGPDGNYYKGLIQAAGAFVHLQKDRLKPAVALFKLAHRNLESYPQTHLQFDTRGALKFLEAWQGQVEAGGFLENPLKSNPPPKLALVHQGGTDVNR